MSNLLIEDNISLLHSGVDFCDRIGDDLYSNTQSPFSSSSIGSHLRHCIDHYRCFLNGLSSEHVDYNARLRSKRIESSCVEGKTALLQVIGELKEVFELSSSLDLKIKMDSGAYNIETLSTVGRELQFLLSHTIHHYALIRVLSLSMGVELDSGFGLAPSTSKYRANQS